MKQNVIVATNTKERLPSTSSGFEIEKLVVRKISKPNGDEGSAETVSLEEVIPDSVLSTDPFNESSDEEDNRPGQMTDVLKHITLDDEAVAEIVTCPIDNEAWTNELLCISDETLGQSENIGPVTDEIGSGIPDELDETVVLVDPAHIEFDTLLKMLQADSHTNVKGLWDDRDINFLKDHLSSSRKIKLLRDVDLKVLIRFLNRHMKSKAIVVNLKLKESDKKQAKFEKLCTIFGYDTKTVQWKTTGRGNQTKIVQKLAEICIKVLQTKVPKRVLNIAHSEYNWIDELGKWEKTSTVPNTVKCHEIEPDYWFYHPDL
ncbi:unnamed protein product [Mytilus coruscus]|uniref:Uncharacterized protein n=1 Tax=Mytilus coruscus TaxID=42192 RepID=A0A6J8A2A1_MYTCO|nr:unnamed protein product [Mytilus coruscus]